MNKTDKESSLEKIEEINESEDPTLSIFCVDSIEANEALLTLVDQEVDEELIPTIAEYGEVLMGIHNRLMTEGYEFINGKLCKQNNI